MKSGIPYITYLAIFGMLQGVILGVILITQKRGNRAANRLIGLLMIFFSYSICHIPLVNTGLYLKIPQLIMTNHPLLFLFGPIFLWYVSVLTDKNFKFKRIYLLHGLPFLLYAGYLLPFFFSSGEHKIYFLQNWETEGWVVDGIVSPLQIIHLFIYIFVINKIQREFSENLKYTFSSIDKINLSWIKTMTNMFIGVFGVMGIFYVFVFLGYKDEVYTYGGDIIALLVSICIYSAGYFAMRQPEIFGGIEEPVPAKKYESSPLTKERTKKYKLKLDDLMKQEKPFLDGNLTLLALAGKLAIPAYQLSQVINAEYDKKFFDFINFHRIEEAKRQLADPKKKHLSVIAIAFDVGFNSKSAFNAAFKKHTSLTPSQYRDIYSPIP